MSASEIDRLEIEIESSARSAIGELDQLSSKLKNVGKVLGNVLKKNSLSSMISPSDTQKIGKEMANNLIKGFNLDKAGSSEVKKQVRSLSREIANGFAKEGKSFDWGAPAEKLASILKESGGIADEVTADYQRLYEAIKTIGKIKINPIDAKSLGDAYKNRNGLFRQKFSQREGIPLDTIYGELSGQFKGILPDAAAVGTVEDQFHALNDALSYYYKLRDSGLSKPEGFEENVYASIVNEVKELTSALEKAKEASRNVKSVDVDADTDRAINNTADAVSELADSMEKFLGTGATPSEIGKIATNLKKFEQIDAGKIKEVAGSIKELGSSFSFLDKIDGSASELLAAVREVRKLGNASSISKKINDSWKPDDMSNLRIHRGDEYIENADYDGPLREPVSIEEPSYNADAMTAAFGEAATEIKNWADAVDEFGRQAGQALNDLGKKPINLDTNSFEAQIRQMKDQMRSLRSEGLGPGDSQYDNATKQMALLKEQKAYYERYYKELAKLSVASEKAIGGEGGAASLTAKQMEDLAKEKAGASLQNKKLGTNAEKTGSSLSKEASKTRAVSKAFGKLSKGYNNILKTVSKPVISGFRNLTRAIRDSQKQYNQGFSIPRMIGMSVLYSTVFGAISSINQAIADGSNNLVQYSNTYNQSISSVVSALTYLKNAWAAAFAPIVNVVAPYIQSFINMIASALNAIGRFFAALTGKGFAVQAKKVYQDYGAGLADTGSGAEDAADGLKDAQKAAEEYQKTILGFDELNVLNKPDEDNGSGGSGGNGGSGGAGGIGELSPADMFETVEVKGPISDWAKKIREAFLAEDWEGLGKILADGINKGLQYVYDAISWDNVGPKITKFINAFTTTFNSLVDNIDWDLMGRTVGAGINTIVRSFNLLVGEGGIDFKNIGTKLSVGLRGAIDEISWPELGNALGSGFMIAWNMLSGFVSDMSRKSDAGLTGWAELGIALGKAVKGIFDKINFGEIGTTLATGLNGVMETIRNFVNIVPWGEMATNLSNGFNNFVGQVKWAEVGQTLSDFFVSALGMLAQAAKEFDWEGLGRGIGEMLSNIDWITIIGQIGTILWEAFSGVISGLFDTKAGKVVVGFAAGLLAINGLFKSTEYVSGALEWASSFNKDMVPMISTAITKIKDVFIGSGGLVGVLKNVASFLTSPFALAIAGVAAGAILIATNWDKISPILSDLWENVLSPFGEFLSDIFSPIVQGISDIFQSLWKEVLEPLGSFISDVFVTAFSALSEIITAVWKNVLEPLAVFLADTFSGAWKVVSGILTNIVIPVLGAAIDVINVLWKDILKPFIEWVSSELSPLFEAAFKSIKAVIDTFTGNLSALIDIITGVFTGDWEKAWSGVKDLFVNLWDGIVDFFSGLPSELLQIGKDVIQGFIDGLSSLVGDAIKGVGKFVDDIVEKFKSGFDTHSPSKITEGIGENVGQGLINGIDNQSGDALRTVGKMADSILDRMEGTLDNMMDNLDRTMKSMSRTFSNAERNADNSAWNIRAAFSNMYIPLPHLNWSWRNIDFGDFSFSIPSFSLSWYKSGGFFNKASVIGVGESGEEAVVPFTNAAAMKRLASAITEQMPAGALNTGESVAINNKKIMDTISEAGKTAVRAAMNTTEMLMDEFADLLMEIYLQTNNSGNDEFPYIINAELRTEDNEVLARAVERGTARRDYRYNRTKK